MEKIRIGIMGYGNLGRGVEKAIAASPDMTLAGVFTRREPERLSIATPGVGVYHCARAPGMISAIDVMILCGGSASDLPKQGPRYAGMFNIVDSFDTHAKIPEYFDAVDQSAKSANKTAIVSTGWDPGLFSIMRCLFSSVLPSGKDYTFWGEGVSQGHSEAIRRIEGVANAVQYTVPLPEALAAVRSGANPDLTVKQKHKRVCYVAVKPGADKAAIEQAIKTMPNYFADYEVTVTFVTEEELKANHSQMPHGGLVFRTGDTGENRHLMEFSLKLDSNPEFTSSVLVAYARAAHRLAAQKAFGAKTVLDIPPALLSPLSGEELRRELV